MKLGRVIAVLLLGSLCGSLPAAADDQRTRAGQLFRAGQAAFAQNDFAAAAQSFEQAHRLLPSGSTLYNAARAWDQGAEPGLAAADYEEALAQADLSAAQRQHAQARLKDLQAQLVAVQVQGPSTCAVIDAAGGDRPLPATIYVVPDTKEILVRDQERNVQKLSIEASAGQRLVRTIATPPFAASVKPPLTPEPAAPMPPPSRSERAFAYWGWAGVSLAAAAATATTIVGLSFLSKRSEFIDGGKTDKSLREETVRLGTFTSVGMGLTLAGAGMAIWGFHRQARTDDVKVSVLLLPQALLFGGQF